MTRPRHHTVRARVLPAVLLLATWAMTSYAQTPEALRLYEEGNERLLAGNHSGAVGSYQAALDQGVASAGLYYNLGLAYYRMDQLGEAIRFFERARRLSPSNRRIAHNLEIARSRLPERFARLPVRFWTRGWQGIVSAVGADALFLFGAAVWMVPFLLVAWAVRTRRKRAWFAPVGWTSLAAGAMIIAAAFAASVRSPFGEQAVIVDDVTPLYSSVTGEEAGITLHEGLTVDVEDREGGWLRVRLPNGVTGWVEARAAVDV